MKPKATTQKKPKIWPELPPPPSGFTDLEAIWVLDAEIDYLADILNEKIAHRNHVVEQIHDRLITKEDTTEHCTCRQIHQLCALCEKGMVYYTRPTPTGNNAFHPLLLSRLKENHAKKIKSMSSDP